MLGTRCCDRCHELETRIHDDRLLALRMLLVHAPDLAEELVCRVNTRYAPQRPRPFDYGPVYDPKTVEAKDGWEKS
jgi:hypothetical protein